jgi:uroporphyrin-III C-methyltransferase
VSFVTAHTEDHGEPDWAALAATRTTLAIYMGMRRIDSVAAALLAHLPAGTPAAVVQWAGGIDERRLLTRLDRLAADALGAGFGSPAVILVGNAVGESAEARCWERERRGEQGVDSLPASAIARAA